MKNQSSPIKISVGIIELQRTGVDFSDELWKYWREGVVLAKAGNWVKIKFNWYSPAQWRPIKGWTSKVVPFDACKDTYKKI